MHRLVQACRGRWRQATQADGPAQQVTLACRTERLQGLEIKPLRAARCNQVDIGQVSEESAGFAGKVSALSETSRHGGPACCQPGHDLSPQKISVKTRIHVARIFDPAKLVALRVIPDCLAGYAQQRPQQPSLAKCLSGTDAGEPRKAAAAQQIE